jgi:hypothetical protein
MSDPIFCVYEHWRLDTNVCFYVGKGKGKRPWNFKRNFHYNNIVSKLNLSGINVDVRIIKTGLSEESALQFEVERIAHWRSLGADLTNYTDGGDGVSGLKHSDETRQKIREKRSKQIVFCSSETRLKISMSQRGIPRGRNLKQNEKIRGRKQSPESVAKRIAANLGKKRSDDARARISESLRGRIATGEARLNMSLAHLGHKHPIETREKMRIAAVNRWAKIKGES